MLHFIVERNDLNAPQIADRINELYFVLINSKSPEAVAIEINSILLFGEQIPPSLLNAAWDIFAKQRDSNES